MTTYLLNSAVLTAYGQYNYSPLDIQAAQRVLGQGYISAIGHAGSAEFCSRLLGMSIPLNRISIEMQPEDQAVIIRIKGRLPENRSLTADEARDLPFEVGLLFRST